MAGSSRKIFVSLTTISDRIGSLQKVLDCLLAQTLVPDAIYVNISEDPFLMDKGIGFGDIPREIRRLATRGLIRLCYVGNTGPYRKLLPIIPIARKKNAIVITADDDVRYPSDWIRQLSEAHAEFGCVVAYRCRAMVYRRGALQAYQNWPFLAANQRADFGEIRPEFHSLFTCPTGRGGILYDSTYFSNSKLLFELQRLAPKQDDLALKLYLLVAGIGTRFVAYEPEEQNEFPNIKGFKKQPSRLFLTNQTANDEALAKLFGYLIEHGLFGWDKYIGGPGSRPGEAHADRARTQ